MHSVQSWTVLTEYDSEIKPVMYTTFLETVYLPSEFAKVRDT